ncbi:hypothetical protein MASR1M60_13310 [Rhodocyclaceae bacterium]
MNGTKVDGHTAALIFDIVYGLGPEVADGEECLLTEFGDGTYELDGPSCRVVFEFSKMFGKPCVKADVTVKGRGKHGVLKDLYNSDQDDVARLSFLLASAKDWHDLAQTARAGKRVSL